MLNRDFWKGRRVFLTGHTGFKGAWASLWLDSLGAKVTGFALTPPTQPNLFEQAEVVNGIQSTIGDIRNFDQLKSAIAECRPELSFTWPRNPSSSADTTTLSKLILRMSWGR